MCTNQIPRPDRWLGLPSQFPSSPYLPRPPPVDSALLATPRILTGLPAPPASSLRRRSGLRGCSVSSGFAFGRLDSARWVLGDCCAGDGDRRGVPGPSGALGSTIDPTWSAGRTFVEGWFWAAPCHRIEDQTRIRVLVAVRAACSPDFLLEVLRCRRAAANSRSRLVSGGSVS